MGVPRIRIQLQHVLDTEDWYSHLLSQLTPDRSIISPILFHSRWNGVLLRHHRYPPSPLSLIYTGDTIPHVLAAVFPSLRTAPFLSIFINRQVVIILCTALISYPLSLYRDITKLAKASALALVSMVIIVFTVVSEGPQVPEEYRGTKVRLISSGLGIFQAIGVISFGTPRPPPEKVKLIVAFVCHHNSLLIYGALKKPTIDRFSTVTHFSTGLSLVVCLIMALAGVPVFKDKTMGNILNNFPSENGIVNLARFCFGFNCFTTLPIELFV